MRVDHGSLKSGAALWFVLCGLSLFLGVGGCAAFAGKSINDVSNLAESGDTHGTVLSVGQSVDTELKAGETYAVMWSDSQPQTGNVSVNNNTDFSSLKYIDVTVTDPEGSEVPLGEATWVRDMPFFGEELEKEFNHASESIDAFSEFRASTSGTYSISAEWNDSTARDDSAAESAGSELSSPTQPPGFIQVVNSKVLSAGVQAGVGFLGGFAAFGIGAFLALIFLIIAIVKLSTHKNRVASYYATQQRPHVPNPNTPYGQ